jgi:hypothetical protein
VPKKLRKQIVDVVNHSEKHDVFWYIKSQEIEQYNGNGGLIPIETYVTNPQYTMDKPRLLLPNISEGGAVGNPPVSGQYQLMDERFTRVGHPPRAHSPATSANIHDGTSW